MKVLKKLKDGGPESTVTGYFLIEIKSLFSIALLHFADGSREAYHSHAFHAISWILKGELKEEHLYKPNNYLLPSIWPVFTSRDTFHKVISNGDSWALTFRGPWKNIWQEYLKGNFINLTHGRKILK